MSEATLQADLQRELLTISGSFSSGDVTINDMSILDNPNLAPFAVVGSADDFEMSDIDTQWLITWQLPFALFVFFTDHDTAANNMTSLRDAVLAKLLAKTGFSTSSAKLSYGLREIRSAGPLDFIYDADKVKQAEANGLEPPLPTYLTQRMICVVEEIQLGS